VMTEVPTEVATEAPTEALLPSSWSSDRPRWY
jgi:hypothetical protein